MAATSRSSEKVLLFLFLLLGAGSFSVAFSVNHLSIPITSPSHAQVFASCSSTLYPELCYSSIASSPSLVSSISDHKSVVISSLNLTKTAVQRASHNIQKLTTTHNLTKRESVALQDCLEMFDETLDEIDKAEVDLKAYPGGGKTLYQHADDLKTLLSATMTNQDSCLDGFSHDSVCKKMRANLAGGINHLSHMCSNSLAMICNMTNGDIALQKARLSTGSNRRLLEKEEEKENEVYGVEEDDGFPTWMSAADRRLLQSSTVEADAVVAADGSGHHSSVSAAVAAAPEKSSKRYVIRIKAGTYNENVEIPKKKTNIMFIGEGRTNTIITGRRNVVDGSTTFKSATVAAVGERFLARDIRFQNTAGPSKHQAVALRVGSDFSAFYKCDIIAYQDTLYVHSLRQFFRDCVVKGTVDFIFGNAAVVLQNCDLQARRPNKGQKNMFTAQGRQDPNQNTGISIQGCTLRASSDLAPVQKSFPTYLGRPWKKYSRTVVMKSTLTSVINPAGWFKWSGNFALNTLYYGEYMNTGAGASTSRRVNWKGFRVITSASEAGKFTPGNFIAGSAWLSSTGFPFKLGL